jgi:hypothetical protein
MTHTKKEPTLISNPTMCRLNLLLPQPSLNIAGGASQFSAAARILLHKLNFPLRAIWPEPAVVKPKPAVIDDTRPLGYEWLIDDKDQHVRRSL